ncbi:transposase [Chryseobacterium sp. RP-3-3]|uniref:Transposase n=1 Tax=Chryseobacterium antibioticum TaxID=2728847 RepID=A0A7Y0FQC9_9FLAO|nr:transposase [Chryseobacterium antibioticum]NML69072.1 transposase [Chryseobacterium antibioticum]
MNADAGFDFVDLLLACEQKEIIPNIAYNKRNNSQYTERILDNKLYREQYSIERTKAWMDSCRTILNRFETTVSSWIGFNFIAFIIIAIKKFTKAKKSR